MYWDKLMQGIMLLLINLFREEDIMETFREFFPECGYSHYIRFHDILDKLVQGKKSSWCSNFM